MHVCVRMDFEGIGSYTNAENVKGEGGYPIVRYWV